MSVRRTTMIATLALAGCQPLVIDDNDVGGSGGGTGSAGAAGGRRRHAFGLRGVLRRHIYIRGNLRLSRTLVTGFTQWIVGDSGNGSQFLSTNDLG